MDDARRQARRAELDEAEPRTTGGRTEDDHERRRRLSDDTDQKSIRQTGLDENAGRDRDRKKAPPRRERRANDADGDGRRRWRPSEKKILDQSSDTMLSFIH
jgi:hypothetical protein